MKTRRAALETLKDKVSVVIGGSRGIGRSIALMLASYGTRVVICARNTDELRETSESIQEKGGVCSYARVDVREDKEVSSFAQKVIGDYGQVDILINNAGVAIYDALIETTLDDWNKMIDTNLRGTFLCSKAFARIMVKQNGGFIINIASRAGKQGMRNLSAYCASKFGVVGLTESMKEELSPFGIEVFCVCPSYVRTEFFRNFPANFSLPSTALQPEDVANQVLRMLTDRSKLREYSARIFHRRAF